MEESRQTNLIRIIEEYCQKMESLLFIRSHIERDAHEALEDLLEGIEPYRHDQKPQKKAKKKVSIMLPVLEEEDD